MDDERRGLWCAVITQAIEDATDALGSNRYRNRVILDARNWLTKYNRDFLEVCRLAGFEPDCVRTHAQPRIDEAIKLDNPAPPKPPKKRGPRIIRKAINEGQEANADR